MKYKVTEFSYGQISRQFEVIGFRPAVRSGMKLMARDVEMNVVDLDKDCTINTSFLSNQEWSCTVVNKDREVYGITVQKAGCL